MIVSSAQAQETLTLNWSHLTRRHLPTAFSAPTAAAASAATYSTLALQMSVDFVEHLVLGDEVVGSNPLFLQLLNSFPISPLIGSAL